MTIIAKIPGGAQILLGISCDVQDCFEQYLADEQRAFLLAALRLWKDYKLHLDVTDQVIPVTAVVTGSDVHDSQAAIPMDKQTLDRPA